MSRSSLLVGAAAFSPLAFIAPSVQNAVPESRLNLAAPARSAQSSSMGTAVVPVAGALCVAGALASRRASRAKVQRRADEAYGASHTSFYTDAVAKDKYDTLDEVLTLKLKDDKLKGMVNELLDACVKITEALRVKLALHLCKMWSHV